MDAADANLAKYKAGFNVPKKEFCKTTPFKLVDGLSSEKLSSLGLKKQPYPTPINPYKTRR